MLAGTLRSKVKLQQKAVVQGPLGQTVTWKPTHEYHARVIPLDVRAVAQYMQLQTQVSHKILLRGTVEINLGLHRLLHKDKTYQPQQSAKHYDGVTEIAVLEVG
jgi:head-tail adaptor